jgi:spore coat protein A, manganese oxidase
LWTIPVSRAVTHMNMPSNTMSCGALPAADPGTTGQVMKFTVVKRSGADKSTPPAKLVLPPLVKLGPPSVTRRISLNELDSLTVCVDVNNASVSCSDAAAAGMPGPQAAFLGTVNPDGTGNPLMWREPVTENPALGATEVWEIHNFTADAHPIHIHLVEFEVVERVDALGVARPPELWGTGTKDTVIAYPGEITRVKALFDRAGLYVWHCHILEHEDNEMMRPFRVGP